MGEFDQVESAEKKDTIKKMVIFTIYNACIVGLITISFMST